MRYSFVDFISHTVQKAVDDDISKEAAALSFFAIFSIIPIVALVVLIAGFVVDTTAIQGAMEQFAADSFGSAARDFVRDVISDFTSPSGSLPFFIITIGLTVYGAWFTMDALRKTFFTIFNLDVTAKNVVTKTVKLKGLTFFYMGLLFVAVYTLIFANLVSEIALRFTRMLTPQPVEAILLSQGRTIAIFVLLVVLFTLIYRLVSLHSISWRASLIGGLTFAVLFIFGQTAFSIYLSLSVTLSFFGAASVLVAFLLWAYYMGIVLFYSAEVAEVWEHRGGVRDSRVDVEQAPEGIDKE